MSKHLDEIIKRLGYAESQYLIYKDKINDSVMLSTHTIKILNTLSPYATYIVDKEPFVLFFDDPANEEEKKELFKKIWNAQIPVAIFCGVATVKVYCGYTIKRKDLMLTEAINIPLHKISENSPFSFWDITSHRFWTDYEQKFKGKRLNDVLLDNLRYLTDSLKNIPFNTKLILRLIFIRYLIDRGVDIDYPGFSSDVALSQETLIEILGHREDLYYLFAHLKNKFNGNLFEIEKDENPNELTESTLSDIKDFLSADIYTKSGQLSFFNLYDFNIIPVELISNIYEVLLGKETQDKDNAFYTPKYLVDYILDKTIDKHIEENDNCKVFDPSCGSGAFLVDSYRRMVDNKLQGALYTEDDSLLRDTLTANIYGIDLNGDAIDVAIFSLYLAMLDYKNPKTLRQFHLPLLRNINMLKCDFFDENGLSKFQDIPFDFIIGNPPWGHKKGMHTIYCEQHGYKRYIQSNDTCRSFILRSKDFCEKNKKVMCSFVLHSKLLYLQKQPSIRFRREFLLKKTRITSIIELSSVRNLIFKNASAPAMILSYSFSDKNTLENRFEYISMKQNIFFRLFNTIVVEKTDVKRVKQRLLYDNDWAWKTLVYGLTGDIDNIMKLQTKYKSLKESIKSQLPTIIKGEGVKYHDGVEQNASHLFGRVLLDSEKAVNHFFLNKGNTTLFEKKKVHRPRKKELFIAPYCLVQHGIDMTDYTMKAVYSEESFVFTSAIYAIKGSHSQKDFLLNIVGLLNSQLYAYLNLMLGSSLGIERTRRMIEEVLYFPFVFSEEITRLVEEIQELKIPKVDFTPNNDASDKIAVLNQIILKEFGLFNNEYIDYALRIQIPQLTGRNLNNAIREVDVQDLKKYGEYFYDRLSEIFTPSGMYIQVKVYPVIAKHYSAFEVMILEEKPTEWFIIADATNQRSMLSNLSSHKINDLFYHLKDVLYFEDTSFYIIKPNFYKNWHPAMALLDFMEVIHRVLSRHSGVEND